MLVNKKSITFIITAFLLIYMIYNFNEDRALVKTINNIKVEDIKNLKVRKKTLSQDQSFYIKDYQDINSFLKLLREKISNEAKVKKGYDNMYQIILVTSDEIEYVIDLFNDDNSDKVYIYIKGHNHYLVKDKIDFIELINNKYEDIKG